MDLEIALSSEPGPYNASHAVADIDTYMANLPETPLEEVQEVANGSKSWNPRRVLLLWICGV